MTWLDGCSAGEEAIEEELLRVAVLECAFSISHSRPQLSPRVRRSKINQPTQGWSRSAGLNMPLLGGTEMNSGTKICRRL